MPPWSTLCSDLVTVRPALPASSCEDETNFNHLLHTRSSSSPLLTNKSAKKAFFNCPALKKAKVRAFVPFGLYFAPNVPQKRRTIVQKHILTVWQVISFIRLATWLFKKWWEYKVKSKNARCYVDPYRAILSFLVRIDNSHSDLSTSSKWRIIFSTGHGLVKPDIARYGPDRNNSL